MATLTKVIKSGNSQAIRIPAGMRLKSKEVEIVSTGAGLIIIDPIKRSRALKALIGMRETKK